jgi:hypothetical protein
MMVLDLLDSKEIGVPFFRAPVTESLFLADDHPPGCRFDELRHSDVGISSALGAWEFVNARGSLWFCWSFHFVGWFLFP